MTEKSTDEEPCQNSDIIGPRKNKSVIKDYGAVLIIIPYHQHVVSGYRLIISISQVHEKGYSNCHSPIVSSLSIKISMAQYENTESLKQMFIIYITMKSFLLKEDKANQHVCHIFFFTETAA